MHIFDIKKDHIGVQLTHDELLIINNALNEVCHGIEIPEFATRIGASLEDSKELLQLFGDAITQLEAQSKAK